MSTTNASKTSTREVEPAAVALESGAQLVRVRGGVGGDVRGVGRGGAKSSDASEMSVSSPQRQKSLLGRAASPPQSRRAAPSARRWRRASPRSTRRRAGFFSVLSSLLLRHHVPAKTTTAMKPHHQSDALRPRRVAARVAALPPLGPLDGALAPPAGLARGVDAVEINKAKQHTSTEMTTSKIYQYCSSASKERDSGGAACRGTGPLGDGRLRRRCRV